MWELISKSKKETQKVAEFLAQELRPSASRAAVIALRGNLGTGKTAFVQGFSKALGMKEKISSPTFVLIKIYNLAARRAFKQMIHIDCYRLDSPKDLLHLGFADFIKDRDAVILVEWADRIKNLLPGDTIWIQFRHGEKAHERMIQFKIQNAKLKSKS